MVVAQLVVRQVDLLDELLVADVTGVRRLSAGGRPTRVALQQVLLQRGVETERQTTADRRAEEQRPVRTTETAAAAGVNGRQQGRLYSISDHLVYLFVRVLLGGGGACRLSSSISAHVKSRDDNSAQLIY